MSPYEGSCKAWSKPYCYKTKVKNILHQPDTYRQYLERVFTIRKYELDYFMENSPSKDLLTTFDGKIILLGNSEGGMIAGRYFHEDLFPKLMGLILSAWTCEFNYYVGCAENAKVCGGSCSKDLPVLNVVGANDYYFGAGSKSVSYQVAHGKGGYGADPLTGNCRAALEDGGHTKFAVVSFVGAGHGIIYSHDNALRGVFSDFIAATDEWTEPEGWPSLKRDGCTLADGVFSCDEGDDEAGGSGGEEPCDDYQLNSDSPWGIIGVESETE